MDILKSTTPLIIQITPSSAPAPIPSLTPSPSPTPSATSIPNIAPCVITSAYWNSKLVTEGTLVSLNVSGSGECHGKKVIIKVKEDDGLLGSQNVSLNPVDMAFNDNNAQTSWIAEYQQDGIFGVWDPPEYFFSAQIAENTDIFKSTNKLTVVKLLSGQSSKGDGDYDGIIGLRDLSILFTHWGKNKYFPLSLDMNEDGIINSFDFSTLRNILNSIL